MFGPPLGGFSCLNRCPPRTVFVLQAVTYIGKDAVKLQLDRGAGLVELVQYLSQLHQEFFGPVYIPTVNH